MPRRWALILGAALVLTAPAAGNAQDPREGQARRCDLVQAADYRQLMNVAGEEVLYFQDPVRLDCTGQVRLEADSAVWNRASGNLELIGRVVYRDSTTELTAEWTNYFGRDDRLTSRGDVVLRDLARGSRVSGQALDYYRATELRPSSRLTVQGGRPHAVLRRSPAAAPPMADTASPAVGDPAQGVVEEPADTAAPLEVWAERLEFVGETVFTAYRNVELLRGEMTGGGERARYDQTAEELELEGGAHVENPQYRLVGKRIDAFLEGESLREVLAEDEARLESEELTVMSERLRIGFVEGRIERLEAWNPVPADAPRRARAVAEDFDLRADSIDARADAGVVREVRAVGRAFGEREPDSVVVALPSIATRDWIQGDTIIGYFAPDTATVAENADPGEPALADGPPARSVAVTVAAGPDAAGNATDDSTGVVLERVVVIGGSSPALSLYRIQDQGGNGERSINFMSASRIILIMSHGEVRRVEAEGPIDGLHLDPIPEPTAEPEEGTPAAEEAAEQGGGPPAGRGGLARTEARS